MKKRKPPIILATLLVLLVGAGFALNTPNLKTKPEGEGQQPPPPAQDQPPQAVGAARAPIDKGVLQKEIDQKMRPTLVPSKPGMPGVNTGQPSIKVTKAAPYVQPNDPNRTSQQWYK
jgi:hypothetical protein